MRWMRWVSIGMTGTVAAATIWLAATGGQFGMVLIGLAISIFGIMVIAASDQ